MSASKPGGKPGGKPAGRRAWIESRRVVDRLVWVLAAVCGLLLAADFVYGKKVHFDFEGWPGFYALFGFLAYVGLVLTAKALRRVLMRKQDYYELAEPLEPPESAAGDEGREA